MQKPAQLIRENLRSWSSTCELLPQKSEQLRKYTHRGQISLKCSSCSAIDQAGQTCAAVKDSSRVVPTAELCRRACFGLKHVLPLILLGGRTATSTRHKPGFRFERGKANQVRRLAWCTQKWYMYLRNQDKRGICVDFLQTRHIIRGGLQLFLAGARNTDWKLRHAVQHAGFDADAPLRRYSS
jgi:hypothetical protein